MEHIWVTLSRAVNLHAVTLHDVTPSACPYNHAVPPRISRFLSHTSSFIKRKLPQTTQPPSTSSSNNINHHQQTTNHTPLFAMCNPPFIVLHPVVPVWVPAPVYFVHPIPVCQPAPPPKKEEDKTSTITYSCPHDGTETVVTTTTKKK